ncbi:MULTISPECIES: hypothetical protein [unclassified Paraburkholderia]|uniref:hypothetical protein n=1 Tax=unclassified Paraburkholderia TaxID=2615204 RepID=UPI002AB135DC|nr:MULTISPECIES: hypothetical protein [unclassified Paraburkholderia]
MPHLTNVWALFIVVIVMLAMTPMLIPTIDAMLQRRPFALLVCATATLIAMAVLILVAEPG